MPDPEEVKARLERLRTYPWSSYRAYVGLAEAAPWLTTRRILEKGQGRTWKQRIGSYRQFVEQAVREGLLESPWQRLEGQMFFGGWGLWPR